jgi:hypothetical protein
MIGLDLFFAKFSCTRRDAYNEHQTTTLAPEWAMLHTRLLISEAPLFLLVADFYFKIIACPALAPF